MRLLALHYGCCALALVGLTAPVRAQESGDAAPPDPVEVPAPADGQPTSAASDRLVYTPLDFAQYAPRSALDMLQQVPGFNIEESRGQGRGLGEATGNVLLNGERISTKSDSVTQRLGRIAAANVIRIEFVDGATLNIPGLSGRVANIIYRADSSVRGQFEWNPQLPTDFAPLRWQQGRASVTGTEGPIGYTVALDNSGFSGGSGGPNIFTFAGGTVEERFSQTRNSMHNPRLSTQLRIDGPGSSVGNFNAQFQRSFNSSREDEYTIVPAGSPQWFERIRNSGDGFNYELGGDVEFALAFGRLKLIALESYRESDSTSQSSIDLGTGVAPTGSQFTQNSRSGERIGRAEFKWQMLGGDWQWSGEGAFNRLNTVAGLAVLTPAGTYNPIPFPGGTGGVTEDRFETVLSFGRAITSTLSMQSSLGGEYSKLSQTGVNSRSRSFKRPKGSLALAWAAADDLDISLRIARRVGQLNFGDFLADVNLSNDNTNAGNAELRPQQTWEVDLEGTKGLGDWGSMTARLYHRLINDYVTIIPLAGGRESVGNIASAKETGVSVNGTIRLEPIGFNGARLDIEGQLRKSSLLDPIAEIVRQFDRFNPRSFNIQFRHDVPGSDWAWGSSFRSQDPLPYYRSSEIGLDYNLRDALGVFVENKDVFGLTVQMRVNNILEENQSLDRTVYLGRRTNGIVRFREQREREIGRNVQFTIRGNF